MRNVRIAPVGSRQFNPDKPLLNLERRDGYPVWRCAGYRKRSLLWSFLFGPERPVIRYGVNALHAYRDWKFVVDGAGTR